jgi:hypothetical protein
MGKTASFILAAEHMEPAEVELEIEKLCMEFENSKDYLVTCWEQS